MVNTITLKHGNQMEPTCGLFSEFLMAHGHNKDNFVVVEAHLISIGQDVIVAQVVCLPADQAYKGASLFSWHDHVALIWNIVAVMALSHIVEDEVSVTGNSVGASQ